MKFTSFIIFHMSIEQFTDIVSISICLHTFVGCIKNWNQIENAPTAAPTTKIELVFNTKMQKEKEKERKKKLQSKGWAVENDEE